MAKHKGQKAKNKSKKAKKAQVPLGPGGTLSKKQKMQSNKYAVAEAAALRLIGESEPR